MKAPLPPPAPTPSQKITSNAPTHTQAPTPATTSAPSSAPSDVSWPAFLGFLRSKRPQLYAMVSEGKLVRLTAGEVALYYTPRSINLAFLKDPERETLFKTLLKDYFKKPMALAFETQMNKSAPTTSTPVTPRPNSISSASVNIIDDAIDVFGPETTKLAPQKASS